jgi:DNA (cytosine-5)-methyltransferase 1
MNYYNEFNPAAAAWLRQLIANGLIPAGDVDTRSITEVKAHEIKHYTQCHFFAGIGGWSLALQLAGWPSTRPVWTGSCPCQPFSSAGKNLGTADPRHLWPVLFKLIAECRPERVFGEQVSKAIGKSWLDGVCSDLEGADYACGAVVLGAHSAGAPNIRQRLYWLADASGAGLQGRLCGREDEGREAVAGHAGCCGADSWSVFDVIPCADGKTRRIESGVEPLVGGLPAGMVPVCDPRISDYANRTAEARVMRLHGYGNSIVPQTAALFIRASM